MAYEIGDRPFHISGSYKGMLAFPSRNPQIPEVPQHPSRLSLGCGNPKLSGDVLPSVSTPAPIAVHDPHQDPLHAQYAEATCQRCSRHLQYHRSSSLIEEGRTQSSARTMRR